jgi:hypothetical protein
MQDRRRLEQLHVLVGRLERLPASRHRDWMLLEVRARAVDVESDVPAAPIRRLDAEAPVAAPEAVRPAPAMPREGGRLCLDELPLEGSEADRHGSSLPWARGLRG